MADFLDLDKAKSQGWNIESQSGNEIQFKCPVNGPKFIPASAPQYSGVMKWRVKLTGNTRGIMCVVREGDAGDGQAVKRSDGSIGYKNSGTSTGSHPELDLGKDKWWTITCDMDKKKLIFDSGGTFSSKKSLDITFPPPVRMAWAGFNGGGAVFDKSKSGASGNSGGGQSDVQQVVDTSDARQRGFNVVADSADSTVIKCPVNGPKYCITPYAISSGKLKRRFRITSSNKAGLVVVVPESDISDEQTVKTSGKTVGWKNSGTNTGDHDSLSMTDKDVDVKLNASKKTLTITIDGKANSKKYSFSGAVRLAFVMFNGCEWEFDKHFAEDSSEAAELASLPSQEEVQEPYAQELKGAHHTPVIDVEECKKRGFKVSIDTADSIALKCPMSGPQFVITTFPISEGIVKRRFRVISSHQPGMCVVVPNAEHSDPSLVKTSGRTVGFKNSGTSTGSHPQLSFHDKKWVDVYVDMDRKQMVFVVDGQRSTLDITIEGPVRLVWALWNGSEWEFDKKESYATFMPGATTARAKESGIVAVKQSVSAGYTVEEDSSNYLIMQAPSGPKMCITPEPISSGQVTRRVKVDGNVNSLVVVIKEADVKEHDAVKTSGRTCGFKNSTTSTGDHDKLTYGHKWMIVTCDMDRKEVRYEIEGEENVAVKPIPFPGPVRLAFAGFSTTKFMFDKQYNGTPAKLAAGAVTTSETAGTGPAQTSEECMAVEDAFSRGYEKVGDTKTELVMKSPSGPKFLMTPYPLHKGVMKRRMKITGNRKCLVVVISENDVTNDEAVREEGRTCGFKNPSTSTGDHEEFDMRDEWGVVTVDMDKKEVVYEFNGKTARKPITMAGPVRLAVAGFLNGHFHFDKTASVDPVQPKQAEVTANDYMAIQKAKSVGYEVDTDTATELKVQCQKNGPQFISTPKGITSGRIHRRFKILTTNSSSLVVAAPDKEHANGEIVKTEKATVGYKNKGTHTGSHPALPMTDKWVNVVVDMDAKQMSFFLEDTEHKLPITIPGPVRLCFAAFSSTSFMFDKTVTDSTPPPKVSKVESEAPEVVEEVLAAKEKKKEAESKVDAAREHAMQRGGKELRRSKMMCVGQGRAGKTTLYSSMLHNTFKEEGLASTVGVESTVCEVTGVVAGKKTGNWSEVDLSSRKELEHAMAELIARKRKAQMKGDPENNPPEGDENDMSSFLSKQNKADKEKRAAREKKEEEMMKQAKKREAQMAAPKKPDMKKGKSIKELVRKPKEEKPETPRTEVDTPKPAPAPQIAPAANNAAQERAKAEQAAQERAKATAKQQAEDALSSMGEDLVLKYMEDETQQESVIFSAWDYGGQEVFYSLHPLFLTRYGVYLLVFSMRELEENEKECLEFIRFWLHSIVVHAQGPGGDCAPILLIGTHKDMYKDRKHHENISEMLFKRFGDTPGWASVQPCREGADKEQRHLLWFFPVDNTQCHNDPIICSVMASIESLTKKEDYIHKKVPFAWLALLDAIEGLKSKQQMTETFDGMIELARTVGLPSPGLDLREEVTFILLYLTELGIISWYDEPNLHDLVILNPNWLITAATKVICKFDIHFVEEHEEGRRMQAEWSELTRQAILNKTLADVLWSKYDETMRLALLQLMVRFGLAVPLRDGRFLIPPILEMMDQESAGNQETTDEGGLECFFHFNVVSNRKKPSPIRSLTVESGGFLPSGLFARLMGKSVMWSESTSGAAGFQPELSKREAVLVFGGDMFVLTEMPELNAVRVQISSTNPAPVVERLEDLMRSVMAECFENLEYVLLLPPATDALKNKVVQFDAVLNALATNECIWNGRQQFAPAQLRQMFHHWLPPMGLLDSYDVFFSYRWNKLDSDFTLRMFDCFRYLSLTDMVTKQKRRVEVFLDRKRLQSGRRFDRDFLKAMKNSKMVVPLVSTAALKPMTKLTEESPVDNVLLEWSLMVELQAHHNKDLLIAPLLIGEVEETPGKPVAMTDLFRDAPKLTPDEIAAGMEAKPLMSGLPKIVVKSIATELADFLTSIGLKPSPELATRTVADVVTGLTKNLGFKVNGLLQECQVPGLVCAELSMTGIHSVCVAKVFGPLEQAVDKQIQDYDANPHKQLHVPLPQVTASAPQKSPKRSPKTSPQAASARLKPGHVALEDVDEAGVAKILDFLKLTKFAEMFADVDGKTLTYCEGPEDLVDMEIKMPKPMAKKLLGEVKTFMKHGVPASVLN